MPPSSSDPGEDAGNACQTDSQEAEQTLYGSEGLDDDCKYQVTWTASPIRRNTDVVFTVTVNKVVGGQPATGAAPVPDVALGTTTHLSPSTNVHSTEKSPGVYTVGPIRFDVAGTWSVRFHFYEMCSDLTPDSPHGHAAFWIDVP